MPEAEFHAVWVDPTGTYRDLTPKRFGFQQSVFLADPSLTYDGKQINNVRVAINHDLLIEEFIAAADQYYEATNRGRLAHLHGDEYLAALTTEQRAELLTIQKRQEKLSLLIAQKYYGLSLSSGPANGVLFRADSERGPLSGRLGLGFGDRFGGSRGGLGALRGRGAPREEPASLQGKRGGKYSSAHVGRDPARLPPRASLNRRCTAARHRQWPL